MSSTRLETPAPTKKTWWLFGGMLSLAVGCLIWYIPGPFELISAGVLILAIAALSYPAWRPLLSGRFAPAAESRLLLFVCTGNTCRSAMAEAVARTILMNQWRVASAGLNAVPGTTMPEDAVVALNELGIPANGHRARQLTPEMIAEADVVYCMTAAHRDAVLAMAPDAADKIARLDPDSDIPDPHGQLLDEHFRTAEGIRYVISQRLVEASPVPASR